MASKTNICKVADPEFDGIGRSMKILLIKDHLCSSINDFREKMRAITNPQFSSRPCI